MLERVRIASGCISTIRVVERRNEVMLVGRNGQVGWELERALAPLGRAVSFGHTETDDNDDRLDSADLDALVARVRKVRLDVIVNAAAYTAVGDAESEPQIAHAVNASAPDVLASAAKEHGAWLCTTPPTEAAIVPGEKMMKCGLSISTDIQELKATER